MIRSILLGALLLNALPGLPCDQCGCSLLSGVQPYERTNNFGLQFRMRYLNGELLNGPSPGFAKHGSHAPATTAASSKWTELYYALEARGLFWLGGRTSLVAAVPLVNNYQAVDGITHADILAVGDPLVMLRYELLNNAGCTDSTAVRHRLTAGVGAKVPLGRHDLTQFGETLDHDLQPGTGTWDGLLSLEYQMRGQRWGLVAGGMGRFNGTTPEGHRFGHGGTGTLEVFRVLRIGTVRWFPSAGGYAESTAQDRTNGVADPGTGGSVLFSHLGSRIWWRSFGLSVVWQHAVLRDKGAMMVPDRERFLAGVTYNLIR
ncbi:MAG: hypothetical protein QM724_01470 [Flavobacteriales bacterium]